ncbi:hypothetical protein [Sphingomonas qomolangmaensis]|uniref:Transposase n=1 Tax=Sphingomonas qomolangmaensis TaxID=2918765 RepID=A0ABY5L689_9SPHN|nr:hypothetical protein [Sphingomonas qomolangmaensis]UUL82483.1 hypothetical protein NMP03_15140 [Sphingomonas qomolangmaensis]
MLRQQTGLGAIGTWRRVAMLEGRAASPDRIVARPMPKASHIGIAAAR